MTVVLKLNNISLKFCHHNGPTMCNINKEGRVQLEMTKARYNAMFSRNIYQIIVLVHFNSLKVNN